MSYFTAVDQWIEDRSAIVTGGSAKMSCAIALAFCSAGSRLIVCDLVAASGRSGAVRAH